MTLARNLLSNLSVSIASMHRCPPQHHLNSTVATSSSCPFHPPPYARLISKSLPLPRTGPVIPEQNEHRQQVWRRKQHKDLLVETFHQNDHLKKLVAELSNDISDPLRLLDRYRDWDANQFWLVVKFLEERQRLDEVLQVFDAWSKRETSRMNMSNYTKIIQLLCKEDGSMKNAVEVVDNMVKHGFLPSVVIYNSMISGYARHHEFENAKDAIRKMKEIGLVPVAETYHGLLRAYGDHRMYDEMSKITKKMELDGCSPNEVTYNLLIVEFAKGRLFERIEGTCRTLSSKRMKLLPSTLIMMLEAYADLSILEKMERIYRRVMSIKGFLKDSLIRKMAVVYIENYRFARLEEFANEISLVSGRTELVWCMLLISSACLLSRKGLESVVQEMENANIKPNVTFTNILALACTKIKDFGKLDVILCQIGKKKIKPDIVTIGVLFDACAIGYDGSRALEVWRRSGFLDEVAEVKTDPLVYVAFGKGSFVRSCEELYSALGTEERKKKLWTYSNLLRLVFSNGNKKGMKDSHMLDLRGSSLPW